MATPLPTRGKFQLLAGPYFRPADDRILADMIASFRDRRKAFKMTNEKKVGNGIREAGIYVWTEMQKGASPEASGYVTPDALKTHPVKRIDWNAVNWSQSNSDAAIALQCSKDHVSKMRARYAPETRQAQPKLVGAR